MTTSVSMDRLHKGLSDQVNRVAYGNERLIVERHHKPLCALVSMEDVALLERLEEFVDVRDAVEALEEAEAEGTITLAEMRSALGL